ncbi:MAG: ABC transporter permease, partial [Bryobacteraceae bacterium]
MPKIPWMYRALISSASWLVPLGRRARWRAEWNAEVFAKVESLAEWNRLSGAARGRLGARCAGAWVDALLLRADALREGAWADVRYGARLLMRSPTFTLSAVLALALGIGVNTALFTTAHALLFRTPPVADPDGVVVLFTSDFSGPRFGSTSYPDFEFIRSQSKSLSNVAVMESNTAALRTGGEMEQVDVAAVSGDYFALLGVKPLGGQTFDRDDAPGMVISERLWERRFGRSSSVFSRGLVINDRPVNVIGVLPAAFQGTNQQSRADIWIPIRNGNLLAADDDASLTMRGTRRLSMIARLAPGSTPEAAQTELTLLASRLHASYQPEWTDRAGKSRRLTVVPLREAV